MRRDIYLAIAFVGACLSAQAQWLNQPTPGAPRTPDGKVNLTGPVPRVNGKPDLSGIWQAEAEPRGRGLFGLGESPNSKYFRDILSDFKPGEEPLTAGGRGNSPPARPAGSRSVPACTVCPMECPTPICCRSHLRSFRRPAKL